MELEEMQNAWSTLSHRADQQEVRTNTVLEKVTQHRYHSKLNKIRYAEFAGTLVCYAGAAYLSVHLLKIDETYLQVMAGLSVALLLLLPIISLASVRAMQGLPLSSATHLETINHFMGQKMKFQKLQKLNVCLALVLMLLSMPVLAAIQGKDLTQIPGFWTIIFPLFVVVALAFAYWVLRSYNRSLLHMENMLADMNN